MRAPDAPRTLVIPTALADAPGRVRAARKPIPLRISSMFALLPTAGIIAGAFFVFVGWTVIMSFSASRLLPSNVAGVTQHFGRTAARSGTALPTDGRCPW